MSDSSKRAYIRRFNPYKSTDAEYYNWYYQNIVKQKRKQHIKSVTKAKIADQREHIKQIKSRIEAKQEILKNTIKDKHNLDIYITETQRRIDADLEHLKKEEAILAEMEQNLID